MWWGSRGNLHPDSSSPFLQSCAGAHTSSIPSMTIFYVVFGKKRQLRALQAAGKGKSVKVWDPVIISPLLVLGLPAKSDLGEGLWWLPCCSWVICDGLNFFSGNLGWVRQQLLTQITPNVESLLIELKPNLVPRHWEIVARRLCANTSPPWDQASLEAECLQPLPVKRNSPFFFFGLGHWQWDGIY